MAWGSDNITSVNAPVQHRLKSAQPLALRASGSSGDMSQSHTAAARLCVSPQHILYSKSPFSHGHILCHISNTQMDPKGICVRVWVWQHWHNNPTSGRGLESHTLLLQSFIYTCALPLWDCTPMVHLTTGLSQDWKQQHLPDLILSGFMCHMEMDSKLPLMCRCTGSGCMQISNLLPAINRC